MDNNVTSIEKLFEKAEEYGTTSLELLKLNAFDKSAEIVSSLATQMTIAIVVTMFILTSTIGISLWLGSLLGTTYYGFFIVAAGYILLAFMLMVFKQQWLKSPIYNYILTQLLKQKSE